MKVLMINGSPRQNGNTALALAEMEKIFREEGIETEMPGIVEEDVPSIAGQKIRHSDVRRYSSRHKSGIHLNGVSGYVDLEGVTKEVLELLIIGEIVQIGKNTSFGFGRYTVIEN